MKRLGTLGNTLLFIGSVLFVILFQIVFGSENGLIGVTIVMASLTMVRRDLTLSPIKNSLKLILLNVGIAMAAIIAIEHFWMAVIFSFIIFAYLGYYMIYSLSKPLYAPFALEYLYLFLSPVATKDIPIRIIASAVGGIIIFTFNYLYHYKGKTKNEDKLLINLSKVLINKCKILLARESTARIDIIVDKSIIDLRTLIYEEKKDKFALSGEAAIKLTIINSLEKLNFLMGNLHKDDDEKYILKEISIFLSTIENAIVTKKLFQLDDALFKIKIREDDKTNYSSSCLSILNILGFIHDALGEVFDLNQGSKKISTSFRDINKRLTLEDKKIPVFSFKFYFGLRIGLGMAIATLFSGFFVFNEGIFVIITTFAIMIPLYGTSKKNIRHEAIGTFLGGIISFLLFAVFKGFDAGVLVILVASYFYSIFNIEYKYSGVLISICAFGVGFIVYNSINILVPNIILLVTAGIIIATIFESLLLPYNFIRTKVKLLKIYKNTLDEYLQEIRNLALGEKHSNIMINLLIFTGILEERMVFNNEYLKSEVDMKFTKDQRTLISSIYELYLWLDNHELSFKTKSTIVMLLNNLLNEEPMSHNQLMVIKQDLTIGRTLEDKIALNTLTEIIELVSSYTP